MLQLDRKQQLVILVLVGIIIFGGGYRFAQMKERAAEENKAALDRGEVADDSKTKDLLIHVTGAVVKPGVYQLPAGSRIIDAVNKAGPTGEADLDVLKLATPVTDGQTIYVPVKGAAGQPGAVGSTNPSAAAAVSPVAASSAGAGNSAQQAGGKVNINTADQAQLDTLPGVGPAYAQRIIQYREINGPFKTIEDIKQVSGIGDKRFEQLKDLITVQ
ncbi:ComE operon protein 1 [Pelotomaculum sp. FP]|uniref:ComEA family DNA-binding protein n=1 Tax=Pelotomaculum sp. FP TaxID=261474 RepID=UPI0010665F89|nr:ComEA family DNA-binding protein [Pelotomaculum sp. FP]TEB16431.1 ComE operon protein 1 [Pelotomaculum sp. FP]